MTQLWYQQATFLLSAAAINQLQPDIGNEVAFVGRSNAGKSSALNVITAKKNLARTSKTPGRTQLINLFALGENQRLVDLPGYGYAKVAQKLQQNWQRLLETYLRVRQSLKGLVLIMDIRHPLKETDQQILQWAITCQLPVHILLTKADKLSRGAALQTLQQINSQLAPYSSLISTQTFSALTKQGVDEARQVLAEWLEVRKETNSMKNI